MNKKGRKKEDEPRVPVKNAADLQRLKIEKLMKNPEKEVVIAERSKEKKLAPPPEFIRNVMGSSAGAGSGEFHVYRHLRRKEYARQKFIQQQKEKARLDEEYHEKILANQDEADERTAKKRAKRHRNKEKLRAAKMRKKENKQELKQELKSEEDDDTDDKDEETEAGSLHTQQNVDKHSDQQQDIKTEHMTSHESEQSD